MNNFIYKKATITDLPSLVKLFLMNEYSNIRESKFFKINIDYIKVFHKIDNDSNQYLMIIKNIKDIVGTTLQVCHHSLL